jgi:N-acetylglucosaminyl-diphospho-decaprenol L-rhamnosyltransferase
MIGIVIITYNSEDVIGRCLDSCLNIADAEVVVVDNHSSDRSRDEVEKRPGVRLIANASNRGFAAAANQGIEALDTTCILLLNPDTVLKSGIENLLTTCMQPRVGAVGGLLLGCDGVSQSGFNIRQFPTPWTLAFEALGLNRVWPGNPVNLAYRIKTPNIATRNAGQPAGAMLMIRRTAWKEIGGFDEAFHPVWFEDVDFCRRLRDAGYDIAFVPDAIAEHVGGHSAKGLPWASREMYWYGSLLRYAAKHFSAPGRLLVTVSVTLGCVPRMLVRSLLYRNLKPVSVYSKVMLLSGAGLIRGHGGEMGAPPGLAVKPQ